MALASVEVPRADPQPEPAVPRRCPQTVSRPVTHNASELLTAGPGAPARHRAETVRYRLDVLAQRLQRATIVARNFTWNMTNGFKDTTRAQVR
jgi:hypothetical protein